ncbi:isopentenyl-diphosphate delta-isomerase [Acrasis kona]|uniref:isopentenyl-diphosphate Delta-isomerase n=1 Tax=Acrasis kona TaxID=1008807 RepID=A0AAW2YLY6_9EUKA
MSTTVTITNTVERRENLDDEQLKLMAHDECILVNERDEIVGHTSKKDCHVWKNILKGDMLHRAFSVFLLNERGELLLQQRSHDKITFPLYWTNTCCSHPLHNEENESDGVQGVRLAARRKLEHELGIPQQQIEVDRFEYMTRILYIAPFDENWGEHEVDYCLVYKLKEGEVLTIKANENEIEDYKYVSKQMLIDMMNDDKLLFTPWFKLIVEKFLFKWWDALLAGESLESHKQPEIVHNMITNT